MIVRRSVWRRVLSGIGAPFVGAAILPAAAPGSQPSGAPPPSPDEVIAAVVDRYRSAPTCERIRVEVRSESGGVSRSWAVVRMVPGAEPRIGLELGPLRIVADGRSLTAVHERNPSILYSAPIPGEGPISTRRLLEALPPVPIPQLDLLLAPDPLRPDLLTPYARSVTWTAATADARSPGRLILTGASDRGGVTLTVKSGQIQSLGIRDDSRGVTIRLQHSPILPCRAEDLDINTDGRTPVASLADLQPRSGVLRPGSPVPDMSLSTSGGGVQRLKELLSPPSDLLPAPEVERLVLLFVRYPTDSAGAVLPPQTGRVDLAEAARALARLRLEAFVPTINPSPLEGRRQDQSEGPLLRTFNFAQVMVLERPPAAEALLGLIQREQQAWEAAERSLGTDGRRGSVTRLDGDHLAWTTDARSSIELFGGPREAGALAVVLDANQRLRSVILLTERTTTESLIDQITAALMERSD